MTPASAAQRLPLLRAMLSAAVAGVIAVVFVGVFALGYSTGYLQACQDIGPRKVIPLTTNHQSPDAKRLSPTFNPEP